MPIAVCAVAHIGLSLDASQGRELHLFMTMITHELANRRLTVGRDISFQSELRRRVDEYTNITGHDADIDLGFLDRLTPHQKRFRFQRLQHFYLWPLYGVNIIKWYLYDDFRDVIPGRIGSQRMPRPKRWELVGFISTKALFLIMALAVPLLVHRFWVVLVFYGVTVCLTGVVVSVVFQLAHCVEEAEFPQTRESSGSVENAWAIHQVETTVDFARGSRIESWLLGGLNFQIEHHLFPRVCHVNYPAISKLVEQTCREFGVKYREHVSFRAGLASHFRWLRCMGEPAPAA